MATLCQVCGVRSAEYTCPRCGTRYCSLDCYKKHSTSCTESFHRDNAIEELKSIRADEDQRHEMEEILRRIHDADLEEAEALTGSEDESGGEQGGLSKATWGRLLEKLEATGQLDVTEEDLTPAELEEFRAALAEGRLLEDQIVDLWKPWWTDPAAAEIELGPRGLPLIEEVICSTKESGPRSKLPAPPSDPIPAFGSLSKAGSSPSLPYIAIQLLYAYCATLRRFNGDPSVEFETAADMLLGLIPEIGDEGHPPPLSPQQAVRSCLAVASTSGRTAEGLAIGILEDVACILELGRSALVLALVDASRLAKAACQYLDLELQEADSISLSVRLKKGRRKTIRQLIGLEKKLAFFISWANESVDSELHLSATIVLEELQGAIAKKKQPSERPEATRQLISEV